MQDRRSQRRCIREWSCKTHHTIHESQGNRRLHPDKIQQRHCENDSQSRATSIQISEGTRCIPSHDGRR